MERILNLVNPQDKLSCGFVHGEFPDGQQYVTIDEIQCITIKTSLDDPFTIKSRLNTFKDLELIICANQALRELGVKRVELYIPYCIGGRSDRKFDIGSVNYIKKVIAPILNSQNFDQVIVMDPHSDVLEACINNFVKLNNFQLGLMALRDINNSEDTRKDICLVSPDAGAYKKIFDFASWYGIKEIITGNKVRDLSTGKIIKTEVPSIEKYDDDVKYVIVDDICDGGRTFIELAKAIEEQKPDAKIYLVVTHGIFSQGFDFLVQHLDGIYTTNSVKDIQDGVIVDTFSKHKTIKSFVKQLDIF